MRINEIWGRILKLGKEGEEYLRKRFGDEVYFSKNPADEEAVNLYREYLRGQSYKQIAKDPDFDLSKLRPEERAEFERWLRTRKVQESPFASAIKYFVKRVRSKTDDADSMKNPVYIIQDETGKTVGHAVRQGNQGVFKIEGHPTVKFKRNNVQQAVDDWANNVVDQPTKTLKPSKSIVDFYKSNKN